MAGIEIDPPVGDAGGMRTKAARMGVECAVLLAAAAAVDGRCTAMDYRCPAGDRFRARVASRRGELERVLDDVRVLQHEILREASRVEAADEAWGRLARHVEGNAARASADAATLEREFRRLVGGL
ncbi:MAG TPA: hypothetical protein VGR61_08160 [Candidatus Dormibacteraeota bacterium]|nr:hypothetical protein [Candidatus Dormibacteraeota bacterium]